MTLYDQVAKFVDDAFIAAGNPRAPKHLEQTVHWLQVLKPDADEEMLIAARSHDIERAFHKDRPPEVQEGSKQSYSNPVYLTFHQSKGADIIGEFLRQQKAEPQFIERVQDLIRHHEDGGDNDQNLLQDADSISFFMDNVECFINDILPKRGPDNVREKFQYMWNRMKTDKAKEIVRPMYEAAMKRLG